MSVANERDGVVPSRQLSALSPPLPSPVSRRRRRLSSSSTHGRCRGGAAFAATVAVIGAVLSSPPLLPAVLHRNNIAVASAFATTSTTRPRCDGRRRRFDRPRRPRPFVPSPSSCDGGASIRRASLPLVDPGSDGGDDDACRVSRANAILDARTPLSPPATATILPFETAVDELRRRLRENENEDEDKIGTVVVSGYVSAKRVFGSSLAFVDLIDGRCGGGHGDDVDDDDEDDSGERGSGRLSGSAAVPTLWKRQDYLGTTYDDDAQSSSSSILLSSSFSAYLGSMHPGTRIAVTGVPAPTKNPGEAVLLVRGVTVLGLPRDHRHVRSILERTDLRRHRPMARDGDGNGVGDVEGGKREAGDDLIPADEVARAAGMETEEELETLLLSGGEGEERGASPLPQPQSGAVTVPVTLAKAARLLLERLPEDPDYPDRRSFLKGDWRKGTLVLPLPPPDVADPPLPLTLPSSEGTKDGRGGIGSEVADASRYDVGVGVGASVGSFNYPISVKDAFALSTSVRGADGTGEDLIFAEGWVMGHVQNRKRYEGSIISLGLSDDFRNIDADDVKVEGDGGQRFRLRGVLHPRVFTDGGRGSGDLEAYGALLSRGAKAALRGRCVVSRGDGQMTLWITEARLLRSSSSPTVVSHLLDLLGRNEFDPAEAAGALLLEGGENEARELAKSIVDATDRRWRAAELSGRLQDERTRSFSSDGIISGIENGGGGTSEQLALGRAYERLREEYPPTSVGMEGGEETNDLSPAGIKLDGRSNRRPGSRWEVRKAPQLRIMINEIRKVVELHPAYGTRPIKILDVGGGKGHLANNLAAALGSSVSVHVVDICAGAVHNGLSRARRKLLPVDYTVADASSMDMRSTLGKDFDVVVALHACGTLSDVALGHACKFGASFVVCPCCFCSNPHLLVPVPIKMICDNDEEKTKGDGWVAERELISASEWLDVNSEKLESLKKVCEVQGDMTLSGQAIHTLCALRLKAVEKHHSTLAEPHENTTLDLSLKKFPVGFSTRNMCVIGRVTNGGFL